SFSNKIMDINLIKYNFKHDEWSFLEKHFDFYFNLSSGKVAPQTTEQKKLISVINESSKPTLEHEYLWFKYISLFSYISNIMLLSHLVIENKSENKSLMEDKNELLLKNKHLHNEYLLKIKELESNLNNKNNILNHLNKELEISKNRINHLDKQLNLLKRDIEKTKNTNKKTDEIIKTEKDKIPEEIVDFILSNFAQNEKYDGYIKHLIKYKIKNTNSLKPANTNQPDWTVCQACGSSFCRCSG
ncbi:DUF413 domain-containing protein, partial [Vibrio cholerae]|nr:DUF413 domain-containing protein [Vibrio cholerae]